MKPWLSRTRILVRDIQEQLKIRPNATHVIRCSDIDSNNFFAVDAWNIGEHAVDGFYEACLVVSFPLHRFWQVVRLDTVEYLTNAEATLVEQQE